MYFASGDEQPGSIVRTNVGRADRAIVYIGEESGPGLIDDPDLKVRHDAFETTRPMRVSLPVYPGGIMLVIEKGGLLLVTPEVRSVAIAPSILCINASEFELFSSRGRHDMASITVETHSQNLLIRAATVAEVAMHPKASSLRSTNPAMCEVARVFRQQIESGSPRILPSALALVSMAMVSCAEDSTGHTIVSDPVGAPEGIAALCGSIRFEPQHAWSLKEASRLSGYSAFHLSRLFHQILGLGLPEYVDRIRAERAVGKLLKSEADLETIAQEVGFTSPNALRNAVREYYGWTPHELRTLGTYSGD